MRRLRPSMRPVSGRLHGLVPKLVRARTKSALVLNSLVTAGHFHHAGIQEILGGPVKKVLFVKETFPQGLKPHSYHWDYAGAQARILQNKAVPSKIKASIGHNVGVCRDDLTRSSV
jgi:hypothetical protein